MRCIYKQYLTLYSVRRWMITELQKEKRKCEHLNPHTTAQPPTFRRNGHSQSCGAHSRKENVLAPFSAEPTINVKCEAVKDEGIYHRRKKRRRKIIGLRYGGSLGDWDKMDKKRWNILRVESRDAPGPLLAPPSQSTIHNPSPYPTHCLSHINFSLHLPQMVRSLLPSTNIADHPCRTRSRRLVIRYTP